MIQELIRLTENKIKHLDSLISAAEYTGDVDALIKFQDEKVKVEAALQQLLTLKG